MRYLFIHQNFPGQFLHLVRNLARTQGNDIVFITEENANHIPGVRKVTYKPLAGHETTFITAVDFEAAALRAAVVAGLANNLKSLGYQPDLIIGHHGWGEMLNIVDVWPGVPLLGYFEYFYHTTGLDVGFDPEFPIPVDNHARVRAKNIVNLLALSNPGFGQTPTRFQLSTYPAWARERIALLPEGVNLAACAPDPAAAHRPYALNGFKVSPGEKLVTFVARDLEPYRGFHIMMRAIPRLLRARPDVKIILVGGDGVSYGARLVGTTWREFMLREVGSYLDPGRVCFAGKVEYGAFLDMLRRSDAHVYLTYPFVASWSLREALACGCAIVASDTAPVHEFVQDGVTGVLTPCLDPARLAERVLELLAAPDGNQTLRANARRFAEQTLRLDTYLSAYLALLDRVQAATSSTSGSSR